MKANARKTMRSDDRDELSRLHQTIGEVNHTAESCREYMVHKNPVLIWPPYYGVKVCTLYSKLSVKDDLGPWEGLTSSKLSQLF